MIKRMIGAAAVGWLAWKWAGQLQAASARHAAVPAKPEHVQTWEGEGGALRATGSQLGPSPSSTRATEGEATAV